MKVDIDALNDEVIPSIKETKEHLEEAKNIFFTIDIPDDFWYYAKLKNIPKDIENINERIENIQKWVEGKIESFGGAESSNKGIIDNILSGAASYANTGIAFWKGIGQFGESIVDLAAIVGAMQNTSGALIVDGASYLGALIIGKEDNWKSQTKKMWQNTMSFVAEEHVENAYSWFYEETSAGQWLDTNAYAPFKSDGIVCEVSSGIGYVTGIVATSIFTGGSTAVIAGMSGTGKYTAEAWKDMRDSAGEGEEWRTPENAIRGMAYGGANGAWEATQWWVGGKLANFDGISSSVGTKVMRISADTGFNASDTGFRTLTDVVFLDKNWEQAWAENGGLKSSFANATVGIAGSVVSEIIDGIKLNKMLNEWKMQDSDIVFAKNNNKYYKNTPLNKDGNPYWSLYAENGGALKGSEQLIDSMPNNGDRYGSEYGYFMGRQNDAYSKRGLPIRKKAQKGNYHKYDTSKVTAVNINETYKNATPETKVKILKSMSNNTSLTDGDISMFLKQPSLTRDNLITILNNESNASVIADFFPECDVKIKSSIAAPTIHSSGGAYQYNLPISVKMLLELDLVKEIN